MNPQCAKLKSDGLILDNISCWGQQGRQYPQCVLDRVWTSIEVFRGLVQTQPFREDAVARIVEVGPAWQLLLECVALDEAPIQVCGRACVFFFSLYSHTVVHGKTFLF